MTVSFSQFPGLAETNGIAARTMSKNVSAGSVISLFVFKAGVAPTVTDSDGNSYALVRTQTAADNGTIAYLYEAVNVGAATPLTITITPAFACIWAAEAYEVLGVPATSPRGVSAGNNDDTTAVATAAPSPGLTIAAGSGVIAYFNCDRLPGAGGPSGYTAGSAAAAGAALLWSYNATKVFAAGAANERGQLSSQNPMRYGSILVEYKAAAGGTDATASGATVTATASLVAGSATGQAGATATGATLTATASLIAGAASGVINGTLDFQAAGMEFGHRTGLGIGTFALDAGASYRYTIHADGLTLGNPLHTSAAITLDGAGKLPNYVGTAVAPGSTYRVVAIRQADGEAAIFSMVAA